MMNLKDKTILITGASGGIGSALAQAFVVAGAKVLVHGRDELRLQASLHRLPAGTPAVLADLATSAGRDELLRFASTHRPNAVVLNAASGHFGRFVDMRAEDIERLIATDLLSPVLLTRALLPGLQDQADSALVLIGSTLGRIGHPGFAAYGATKAGLYAFAEALSRELGRHGPRVLHVAPRATRTSMNNGAARAMNAALRVTEDAPETVAAAVIEALRRNARRLQIGLPERILVRVNAVLPSIVDRALAGKHETIMKFATISSGVAP